jgi:drug/metabolite transporter (DMT)-like permease
MELAILLALAASFCTATASVCQRAGARSTEVTGFDVWLVFRLARRPVWLLGIASMILGFAFQVSALRFGPLALVQPVLALELLFVFAYMTVSHRVTVRRRDWLAAVAMSAGIGLFLRLASPSGGRPYAPGSSWWLAGLITLAIVLLILGMAFGPRERPGAPRSRRAALIGTATGISWGFVAAVIKELSSHLGDGLGAVFSNWSPYVLVAAGAATMLLASHALARRPARRLPARIHDPGPVLGQPAGTVLVQRAHQGRGPGSGRRGAGPIHRYRRRHGPQPQPPHHRRQAASRMPGTRRPTRRRRPARGPG